jgi:hypothetical protein
MSEIAKLQTGEVYKDEVKNQWDQDACGSHYVEYVAPDTLEWFLEAERYRYAINAPWMFDVLEFDRHAGEHILEIGGGMGTDHAQFAKAGIMYDLDCRPDTFVWPSETLSCAVSRAHSHGDGGTFLIPTTSLIWSTPTA